MARKPKVRIRAATTLELRPGDRVWAYARHSPGEDQTIFSQKHDLEEYSAQQGLIVDRWFIDEARSGGTGQLESRGAFEELVAASRQQPPSVKAILVWDLGRFSRDELESQFYSADFRIRGYPIVSLKDPIPAGEFAGVFEAFIRWKNQRYLKDLQAATLRGLDALVTDHQVIDGVERTGFAAGGFPPRGYVARTVEVGLKPSGKPITRTVWEKTLDDDLRARVELAWRMAIEAACAGHRPPYLQIHQRCRIHRDSSSYYDMFRIITYAGLRKVGARLVEGAHEAYVSRTDFELVQSVLDAVEPTAIAMHYKRATSRFPFSGRVFCGHCGAPINYDLDHRRGDYATLRCSRRKNRAGSCELFKTPYSRFLEGLIRTTRDQVLSEDRLRVALAGMQAESERSIEELARQIEELTKRARAIETGMERLLDAIEAGEAPGPVRARLAARERERLQLVAEIAQIESQLASRRGLVLDPDYVAILASLWRERLDGERRIEFLQSIVARAELTNEGGRVLFTLPPAWLSWYPVGGAEASPAIAPLVFEEMLPCLHRRRAMVLTA